jgi:hypothetical protein
MFVMRLYRFLLDLHLYPVTMGARVVFCFTGALLAMEGIEMILRIFRATARRSGTCLVAMGVSASLASSLQLHRSCLLCAHGDLVERYRNRLLV